MFDDDVADQVAPSNRASRRSIFARPYICRLTRLSFVICASTWPFDQGCVIAARTAALSLRTPVARDETRLAFACAIQASSLASSFFRIMSWNWSMSVRASTRDGTPASTAAMTTASALVMQSLLIVMRRAIVLADGILCSCCLLTASDRRRRVVHSPTERRDPRNPCACKRRQSSAPLRQPLLHWPSRNR